MRELFYNLILITEHQQACCRGMQLSILSTTNGSQLIQEIHVRKFFPNMAGAMVLHAVPITMEAVIVKHIQIHRFQNYHVLCFRGSIPEH